MDVGRRIRELREEQHLTQEELGRRVSVDPQTIYRYESGSRFPSLPKLEELAEALGVGPEELVRRPLVPAK